MEWIAVKEGLPIKEALVMKMCKRIHIKEGRCGDIDILHAIYAHHFPTLKIIADVQFDSEST